MAAIWTGDVSKARALIEDFFKTIAVHLAVSSYMEVIEAQSSLVLRRVPKNKNEFESMISESPSQRLISHASSLAKTPMNVEGGGQAVVDHTSPMYSGETHGAETLVDVYNDGLAIVDKVLSMSSGEVHGAEMPTRLGVSSGEQYQQVGV